MRQASTRLLPATKAPRTSGCAVISASNEIGLVFSRLSRTMRSSRRPRCIHRSGSSGCGLNRSRVSNSSRSGGRAKTDCASGKSDDRRTTSPSSHPCDAETLLASPDETAGTARSRMVDVDLRQHSGAEARLHTHLIPSLSRLRFLKRQHTLRHSGEEHHPVGSMKPQSKCPYRTASRSQQSTAVGRAEEARGCCL
jgi:hypothetical protein